MNSLTRHGQKNKFERNGKPPATIGIFKLISYITFPNRLSSSSRFGSAPDDKLPVSCKLNLGTYEAHIFKLCLGLYTLLST